MDSVIGIDEVGRGAWAGPLLVVAVRGTDDLPEGLADSKLLTRRQREMLAICISSVCDIGEGWVTPAEIDELGLTEAMRLAVSRALSSINAGYDEVIIIDGNLNYCDPQFCKVRAVVKADSEFPIVSAASIYAKVTRDSYMSELPVRYRAYEFSSHVGYGTSRHSELLKRYGVSDMHRRSFKPIKGMMS